MAKRMTSEVAARELDALTGQEDPEADHGKADDILLAVVQPEVREAYRRLVKRSRWWA